MTQRIFDKYSYKELLNISKINIKRKYKYKIKRFNRKIERLYEYIINRNRNKLTEIIEFISDYNSITNSHKFNNIHDNSIINIRNIRKNDFPNNIELSFYDKFIKNNFYDKISKNIYIFSYFENKNIGSKRNNHNSNYDTIVLYLRNEKFNHIIFDNSNIILFLLLDDIIEIFDPGIVSNFILYEINYILEINKIYILINMELGNLNSILTNFGWIIYVNKDKLKAIMNYFENKWKDFIHTSNDEDRFILINSFAREFLNTNITNYKRASIEFYDSNKKLLNIFSFIYDENNPIKEQIKSIVILDEAEIDIFRLRFILDN